MAQELTQARLKELLHYDPETGVFTWKVQRRRMAKAGDIAGRTTSNGRIQIGIDGGRYLSHRLAWLYVTGTWPAFDIDHADNDFTNNRFNNLRPDPNKLNQQNQHKAHSNSKSGYLGVSPVRGKWQASILVKGSQKYLGIFDTVEAAYQVYLDAKRTHHPFSTI